MNLLILYLFGIQTSRNNQSKVCFKWYHFPEDIWARSKFIFNSLLSINRFIFVTFRAESDDANSNKLVFNIFNSILQTLVKPLMLFSLAKIWNELFKWLAIVDNNDETIDRFVGTFLSLSGNVQDNIYTHFEVNNVSLDSAKKNNTMKFTVPIIYKILWYSWKRDWEMISRKLISFESIRFEMTSYANLQQTNLETWTT